MSLGVSAIGQGLLYGLIGLGLFLTFRVLDFPDMTVEGTFPFGAAVAVSAITHGISPIIATLLATVAGMLAGLVTGLLTTKGRIPVLLAGILVMTGLFSINLRIMGRANLSLLHQANLFQGSFLKDLPPYFNSVVIGLIVVVLVVGLLMLFLNTQLGQGFIVAVILGSIIYRFVLLVVLALGFNADDLKLISAVVLAIAIMVPQIDHQLRLRRVLQKGVQIHG